MLFQGRRYETEFQDAEKLWETSISSVTDRTGSRIMRLEHHSELTRTRRRTMRGGDTQQGHMWS